VKYYWGAPRQDRDTTAPLCKVVVAGAAIYFGIHLLVWLLRGCPVAS